MLKIVQNLIEELHANSLTYCHWKSNLWLAEALDGETDIDLLISRRVAPAFRAILAQLNFRPAHMEDEEPFPAMEHYYALDEESGVLAHVHAYYEVITGESLAKNYRFPIEEMLFQNKREQDGVWVPTKGAELVIFTIRMMLKHTSFVELLLLARDWSKVKQERAWLMKNGSMDDALHMVRQWLPSVDLALFTKCVAAMKDTKLLLYRIVLGRRLRSQLRTYARHSTVRSWLIGLGKFATMSIGRLTGTKKRMKLSSGGAVIAFVGPEATGKSTLLAETKRWLGEHFVVEQIHAGKPRATILSVAPNLLLPALRSLLPAYRSGNVETQFAGQEEAEKSRTVFPLIFGIRAVLLAYDRRALLTSASARAAKGSIVLCDRYPSTVSGATDSPQLSQFNIRRGHSPLRYLLAQTERRLYKDIPAPDLVISLSVPLEIALMRNKNRGKEEPEDFVRRRHAHSAQLVFEKGPVFRIGTDRPLNDTVAAIKKAVWQAL